MKSYLLLIVGTFIYKERVQFFSFVLHRLPRKCLEYGVAWLEKLEVIILEKDREQLSNYAPGQILKVCPNFPNLVPLLYEFMHVNLNVQMENMYVGFFKDIVLF